MRALTLALTIGALLSQSMAWAYDSNDGGSVVVKRLKPKPKVEDFVLPEPAAQVTELPLELLPPEERVERGFAAFNHLRTEKISCMKWNIVNDTSIAIVASTSLIQAGKRTTKIQNLRAAKFFRGAVKGGFAGVAILAIANLGDYLFRSEHMWSAETLRKFYNRYLGLSSGNSRAVYFASSDQAYAEFLSLNDERDVRSLMSDNPLLIEMTVRYDNILRSSEDSCRAVAKMKPKLFESEEIQRIR